MCPIGNPNIPRARQTKPCTIGKWPRALPASICERSSVAPWLPRRTCAASNALPLRFDPLLNGSARVAARPPDRSRQVCRSRRPRDGPRRPQHGRTSPNDAARTWRRHRASRSGRAERSSRQVLRSRWKMRNCRSERIRVLQDREQIVQSRISSASASDEMTRRSRINAPIRAR